jgi:hypothetical protein
LVSDINVRAETEFSENRVLRRIIGPKRDEIIESWRKLHNEELHNLYSSPNIIRRIPGMKHEWGRGGMYTEVWWESQ